MSAQNIYSSLQHDLTLSRKSTQFNFNLMTIFVEAFIQRFPYFLLSKLLITHVVVVVA